MAETVSTENAALEIIRDFESFSPAPYLCPAGVWTIGYGTTFYPATGREVKPSDPVCTVDQANQWLVQYVKGVTKELQRQIPGWDEMAPTMHIALLSFAHNLGEHFYGDYDHFETITKALEHRDWQAVPDAFLLYKKGDNGEVLPGLIRRRQEEADLWNSGLIYLQFNEEEQDSKESFVDSPNFSFSTGFPSMTQTTTKQDFLNTFKYYKGEPHQEAAAAFVYDSLSKEEIKAFFERYRTPFPPAKQNPLVVPYYSQRDNPGGDGDRECFATSCAMVAAFHGAIKNEQEYLDRYPKFGASTDPNTHIQTLQSFGLKPKFITTASLDDLKKEIDEGYPVPVGWLHHGPVIAPAGGGHWSVVIGYNDTSVIMHDPYGEADLVRGGYVRRNEPNSIGPFFGKAVTYSFANWVPRWSVADPTDGWMMRIRK